MLIVNPDLINSCRVCRSPNQDGDYECLYQQIKHEEAVPQLSEAGKLYENLLDISLDSRDYYPQYLCNSCDLQMKLFKKLKDKAMKTLEYLQQLYKEQIQETKEDGIQEDCNEEQESIATNMEQYGVELEMSKLFNEVEETFIEEQEDDLLIAKEELIDEQYNSQNEEFLQTFQENQNFVSLTTFTKEVQEYIEASGEQYEGKQKIYELKEELLNMEQQTEVLDVRDNKQREDMLVLTYPEENNLKSLASLNREEVQSIKETGNEMQTICNVVNEPNREQQEINPISEEAEEVLENFSYNQTEEILQSLQEETPFKILTTPTPVKIESMEVSNTQYKVKQKNHTIFNNLPESNVKQLENNKVIEQNVLVDNNPSQTPKIPQSFPSENLQSLPLPLNLNEFQQFSSLNYENLYNKDKAMLNVNTATSEYFQIKLDSQDSCSVLDKSDYVTEIYELMEDDSKSVQYSETSEYLLEVEDCKESKAESCIAYSNIEYIESIYMESNEDDDDDGNDDINRFNTPKRRKQSYTSPRKKDYQCAACQQEFKTLKEYKKHRSLVHNELYPCRICSKQLKTQKSLTTHLKLHNMEPFRCKICQKTFNQKVHYQYHMNRHNNIRNFKCEECGKAFITKTDLKVHMRFHTGQRSYICDICGKSYWMMEHLKAHSLKHTQQKFQCELCQQNFATPKTLKQHMETIHAEEPNFKCEICLKPFRRKHHLEYHNSTLHQTGINLLNTHYTLVDETDTINETDTNNDTDYVKDDFINYEEDDENFVDDPGYVVLNE